ncbi:YfbR-like 5'-deoxynucleotidase [Roseitalea porphyridii]|uniref:HD family hydrolase n=1 Tax=Roseitalea porphyridii TaxID=1852022 RepID=A0A4P6V114_9HYPH|nr:HD family hydrolase [Roseitalea porphyridii]QBK30246.1 HD family hydrolase [Roseitalea porphyridii]
MPDKAGAPPRAWQRMLSGRRLDLLDPSPLDVEISDIAHGLARVARWNGQTRGDHAFSVAQHCLVVEHIVRRLKPDADRTTLLMTLLHDAPEYVIGDMISPFKQVMGGDYKLVESRLQQAIHLRFSLPAQMPAATRKLVKRADMIAAFYEATRLAGFTVSEAGTYFGRPRAVTPDSLPLEPMPASETEAAFLARFADLEARAGRPNGKG